MPNTTPLLRQKAVLRKLRQKQYATFEEIQNYVQEQLEIQRLRDDKTKPDFSKRTFQRDVKDIAQLYGIYITYSNTKGGYFIEEDYGRDQALDRMLESFETLNAFKFTQNITPFVHLSARKPQGTEHLYGLLHAIQNHLVLSFDYQKFWEPVSTSREVKPYALKEYRDRWYLLAEDQKDSAVKTFGLDRMSRLHIGSEKFETDIHFDVSKKYKHCFGVIGPLQGTPEEIVLSFTPFQGKYIKSLPLHHSQEILSDNDKEVRVSLTLYPTYDFVMELLSFGSQVKVVQPVDLAKKLKEEHRKSYERYAE